MIADLNVHWDVGSDGLPKPHAHVMLTMRQVGEEGFGPKVRERIRICTGRLITGVIQNVRTDIWAAVRYSS